MSAKQDWYYRHPKTYQTMRFNEAHKEFVRSKRSVASLGDSWDDKGKDKRYSKSWKDRYKCRKQWMRESKRRYSEWESPRDLIERLQVLTGLEWGECEDAVMSTARTYMDIFGNNESAPYYDYNDAVQYIEEKYKMLLMILCG